MEGPLRCKTLYSLLSPLPPITLPLTPSFLQFILPITRKLSFATDYFSSSVRLPLRPPPPGSSLFEASKEDRRLRVRSWAEKHAMQMKTTLRLLTASWWPLERSQVVWEASTMSQSQHWFLRLFLEVTVWTIADSTLAVLREMMPPLPPPALAPVHLSPLLLSLSLSLSL
jgi:hypothetical protein